MGESQSLRYTTLYAANWMIAKNLFLEWEGFPTENEQFFLLFIDIFWSGLSFHPYKLFAGSMIEEHADIFVHIAEYLFYLQQLFPRLDWTKAAFHFKDIDAIW